MLVVEAILQWDSHICFLIYVKCEYRAPCHMDNDSNFICGRNMHMYLHDAHEIFAIHGIYSYFVK